jgi:hypothetical protein
VWLPPSAAAAVRPWRSPRVRGERGESVLAAQRHGGADEILNRGLAFCFEPSPGSIRHPGPRGGIDLRVAHRQPATPDLLADRRDALGAGCERPHRDDNPAGDGSNVQLRTKESERVQGRPRKTHTTTNRVDARPRQCESESKELQPMGDLGKYWASAPTIAANPLNDNLEFGVSHRIDIAGVASSILATPTMIKPALSTS